jgi:DNA recombination protein RmuC
LIAALKMISDLWKREYQNRNAIEIAERGAALYDKLVNFVSSLTEIDTHLDRARRSYDNAYGQLKSGKGNLIGQAEKLRELGVKAKKSLPSSLTGEADER